MNTKKRIIEQQHKNINKYLHGVKNLEIQHFETLKKNYYDKFCLMNQGFSIKVTRPGSDDTLTIRNGNPAFIMEQLRFFMYHANIEEDYSKPLTFSSARIKLNGEEQEFHTHQKIKQQVCNKFYAEDMDKPFDLDRLRI